jgi:hypothetical protein
VFIGTTSVSDFSSLIPRHFACSLRGTLRARIVSCSSFGSCKGIARRLQASGFFSGVPSPVSRREVTRSLRFLWCLCRRAPLFDPGGASTLLCVSVLPSAMQLRRPPRLRSFRGSITRPIYSLSTLRRRGHPRRRKTRFRLAYAFTGRHELRRQAPLEGFFDSIRLHRVLPLQAFPDALQLLRDRMQQDCMQCSPVQSHGRSQRPDATDEPDQARSISPSNPALKGTL